MQTAVCAFHGLLPVFQIYNAKSSESQGNFSTTKRAFAVRAPMFNGFHHLLNDCFLILPATCKSTDTTHVFLRILPLHQLQTAVYFSFPFTLPLPLENADDTERVLK